MELECFFMIMDQRGEHAKKKNPEVKEKADESCSSSRGH